MDSRLAPLLVLVMLVIPGCGAQVSPSAGSASVPAGSSSAPAGSGSAPPAQTTNEGTPVASGVATPKPGPPIASLPTITRPPTLTGPGTLTKADNGVTVWLRVGQSVTVTLTSDGMFSWYPPTATSAAMRRDRAGGGYPAMTAAWAVFTAVQPGVATLRTSDDTACLHTTPRCLPPVESWQVTVEVRAA